MPTAVADRPAVAPAPAPAAHPKRALRPSQPVAHAEPAPPAAPRRGFFYGWLMVPVAALLHAGTGVGQTYGVSVFNPLILADLGVSETALSLTYMVASLVAATPLPMVGLLIDKYGLRAVAIWLVIGLAGGCAVTGFAPNLVVLALGFFLLRTLGQGALTLVASNAPAMWFDRRLGLAGGLVALGQSAAIAFLPAVFLYVISGVPDAAATGGFAGLGWRQGYLFLGLANAAILLPVLFFVFRNRPEDVGQHVDGAASDVASPGSPSPFGGATPAPAPRASLTAAQAYRTIQFWYGAAVSGLWGMIATAIFYHLLTMLAERGVSKADAAVCFTVFAGMMAGWQFLGGVLADRIPPRFLLSVFGLLAAAGCGLLFFAQDYRLAWGMMAAFGSAQGLLNVTMNVLWPRFFGVAALGAIRGSVQTLVVAACAAGPVLVALSREQLGSENPALLLFGGLLAAIALTAPFLRPPVRA
ncbi:MFS transporter [Alienimonas californiensis]|uniref:Major Facilitator Superfamily protein n=1 Tax=Alienimonas californiensis TaxID=2527989 RepID=A0A517P660_9PLAN|nr:MFS transporter [Alienimonas californiensis]QDT14836.1 Major Facilitator Superfamily protein [Alienimonas californiensis]